MMRKDVVTKKESSMEQQPITFFIGMFSTYMILKFFEILTMGVKLPVSIYNSIIVSIVVNAIIEVFDKVLFGFIILLPIMVISIFVVNWKYIFKKYMKIIKTVCETFIILIENVMGNPKEKKINKKKMDKNNTDGDNVTDIDINCDATKIDDNKKIKLNYNDNWTLANLDQKQNKYLLYEEIVNRSKAGYYDLSQKSLKDNLNYWGTRTLSIELREKLIKKGFVVNKDIKEGWIISWKKQHKQRKQEKNNCQCIWCSPVMYTLRGLFYGETCENDIKKQNKN